MGVGVSVNIIQGDVREKLRELPADYFDCIVTSPPYFGLRDYGTATWEGGEAGCEHSTPRSRGTDIKACDKQVSSKGSRPNTSTTCRCGARRIDAQIGLEPTLDAYLETMVSVCRELRRVLKPSGVFFLNIGDSYNGGGIGGGPSDCSSLGGASNRSRTMDKRQTLKHSSLKPKDLCLVPQRLGIALQSDGWWVRSHIIWHKKNPMPESCTDRPTSAHETIWLLTKNERYFWDAEAVREPINPNNDGNIGVVERAGGTAFNDEGRPIQAIRSYAEIKGANLRNVWSVASQPYPGAHFATMPPEIVERCIKAGSSEHGCCPTCERPWMRVVERTATTVMASYPDDSLAAGRNDGGRSHFIGGLSRTIGWEPSCKCPRCASVPSRILDPFGGAGTTALVADRLGRDCTLIELNPAYVDMAKARIESDGPLFAEVAAQ